MGIEIIIVGGVVAIACALPGVFLVLRRMALMSDAISHSVLPGIVLGFFLAGTLESPLLIIGAVLMSMVTVTLTELLYKTGLVKSDAAIGMVFPALFSIGVILVSKFAGNVHLDNDAVLLGEIALAPLDRITVLGLSIPRSLFQMSIVLLFNLILIVLFYKELKVSTFDPGLAASFGFKPGLIHYGLMLAVSITAVGAFDSVGSILVVAFIIAPAAAAYLITDDLKLMLILSSVFGVISSFTGYYLAFWLDVSIAGMMATVTGVIFLLALSFSPKRGLVSRMILRKKQKWEFSEKMLAVHILHHEKTANAKTECREDHLSEHINWSRQFSKEVIKRASENNLILCNDGFMELTEKGRSWANEVMTL
jgi:manganese/zinc/iron transport system permease protein